MRAEPLARIGPRAERVNGMDGNMGANGASMPSAVPGMGVLIGDSVHLGAREAPRPVSKVTEAEQLTRSTGLAAHTPGDRMSLLGVALWGPRAIFGGVPCNGGNAW